MSLPSQNVPASPIWPRWNHKLPGYAEAYSVRIRTFAKIYDMSCIHAHGRPKFRLDVLRLSFISGKQPQKLR